MTQPVAAPDRFVFDACALIAYFTDEEGAEKAERLIEQTQERRLLWLLPLARALLNLASQKLFVSHNKC